MDALKKQRRVMRTAFTKAHTAFLSKMESDTTKEEKTVAFQFLETKMAELDLVHVKYNEALFDSTMAEDELMKEIESDDQYKTNYLMAKMKISEALSVAPVARQVSTSSQAPSVSTTKLPRIELPKFNGSVREWLSFWSQFKKINDDRTISNEDKFQYLLQATVSGSRANELVNSFPPTGENYEKAVLCLKNRFGRDDIVVEYYVRELLGLVLQNAMKSDKKASLSSLYDKIESYIRALNSLGVTTDKCAAMLYPLVESSLPEQVLRAWQRSGQRGEVPESNDRGQCRNKDRLTLLLEFLQKEVENEERIDMALTGFRVSSDHQGTKKMKGRSELTKDAPSASMLLTSKDDKVLKCVFCKSNHESVNCESARKLNLDERRQIVKKESACFNCLKRGHVSKQCRVNLKCEWCGKRHVLLMCYEVIKKGNNKINNQEKETISDSKEKCEVNLAAMSAFPEVCLQTLRVKLYSNDREKIVRAVIDTASQRSYVRADVARELGYLSVGQQEIAHSLFGGVKSECRKHDTFLIRMKNLNDSYACNFKALDQKTICDTIPTVRHDTWVDELKEKNIILSDIGEVNKTIDVLIGADVTGKLMTGKKFDLPNGLTVFETYLGWTVMGKLPVENVRNDTAVMVTSMLVREASISELWSLDVLGIMDPIETLGRSVENDKTREFLKSTTRLDDEGRYEVKLPWIECHAPLASNFDIAQCRLTKSLEKLKRENLYDAYDSIFKEWEKEGIIETVPDNELNMPCHYLPHRPVIKPHSTTAIRPVFDASAHKQGHPSLNHCVERGPNLIEQIPNILHHFREEEIGVVADIRKAFLQISVDKADRDFLRFLWVTNDQLIVKRHCRVVFGLACSPFLLAAILELHLNLALKKAEQGFDVGWSKKTVEKLKNSFYVDNCVTSVGSHNELEQFLYESRAVMTTGGFDLRGWENSGDSSEKESSLVLGISWNKKTDTLSINPQILDFEFPNVVTKRVILSTAQKIYDPIGIVCPVSLRPKVLLQKLCEDKLSWDAEIEGNIKDEFLQWFKDLPLLKHVEIPRKFGEGELTLHVFGDASGHAYATVIFARVEHEGVVRVSFLDAKSRIAPKSATIPRLELMAATIAARLAFSTIRSLTRRVTRTIYWSDSTTALAWIKRDLQWGTFVWNRVKEIRSLSERDNWRYIPSALNPADLPSRGCSVPHLIVSKWWLGPEWLYKSESEWPDVVQEADEIVVSKEVKKGMLVPLV